MNAQQIQAEKLDLIGWIYSLQDVSIIEKLKSIQKNIEIDKSTELNQWQKDIIDERLDKIANGNEKFQDFETAIDEIEK
ncbi:MAG: hypothetical protein DRI86_04240 [Bacteroidetes bacterium]|nr:MAG: hypothetical protein DRI86_04240 [Bacteroidota bacterium]